VRARIEVYPCCSGAVASRWCGRTEATPFTACALAGPRRGCDQPAKATRFRSVVARLGIPGPFGREIMPLDGALDFIASESSFWTDDS
jgi:hypothetical protein